MSSSRRPESGQGFTLIEILIAMAIMGILAAVGFSSFAASLQRSRDAQRKSGLSQMQKALENFVGDNGVYPMASGDHRLYDDTTNPAGSYAWGGVFDYTVRGETVQYMKQMPKDPKAERSFEYFVSNDRKKYVLYAALENTNDPAADNSIVIDCGVGIKCNYFVMSSNLSSPASLN